MVGWQISPEKTSPHSIEDFAGLLLSFGGWGVALKFRGVVLRATSQCPGRVGPATSALPER